MGRIADALQRAERERREAMVAQPVGVETLDAPPMLPPGRGADIAVPPTPIEANSPARNLLAERLSESLVPFYERSSLVTEQYRSLRTRLLSQNPHYEHRVLAVTSALPKEGKSVTTLNLGCILAEIRHLRILVVDGDFRRSTLATLLGQPSGPGLADVLAGASTYEEVKRSTPVTNLTFIPAGSTGGRSAAELLTASTTQAIFQQMQKEYDYTIVDTPPLTTVTDMGIIGPMCSGAIMVVRLHRTVEAAAKRAVRLLQVNNIPVIGCLIIGREAPSGGYGYPYRAYYRYQDPPGHGKSKK